jgi:two-component system LytT family sensor kinase
MKVLFFIVWDYIHVFKILPALNAHTERDTLKLTEFIKSSLLLYAYVIFSTVGTYYNWYSLARFKIVIEKDRNMLNLELNHLKHQFNSHLTFNFLNFCYSKMLSISPHAALRLENYSEMLHYSLKTQNSLPQTLEDEIEYIKNFISIQECITNDVNYTLDIEGESSDFIIQPMILPFFIENAFKHGDISDKQNPIKIKLRIEEKDLCFFIFNKKTQNLKKTASKYIGNSIQQTLDMFYSNTYTLDIKNLDKTYIISLKLPNLKK